MGRVAIIGAGAAGLIAAGFASREGHSVTVFEKNSRPARKVMITGKGRCNITNSCDLNTLISSTITNGRFLYSAFSTFAPTDIISIIEDYGVKTKVERGNRVFPESDKAVDVVDALVKFATDFGAEIVCEKVTDLVAENNHIKEVVTDKGRYEFDAVIIATGGKSYTATGSTGDGYVFASKLGHTITELKPSLVPLEIHEGFVSDLQGLSLKNVSITVKNNNKTVYSDFGEMLFTHFGVSGPMILSCSSHLSDISDDKYKIYLDLKPALTEEVLDKRIQREFLDNSNKDFLNSLSSLLPRKLIPVIIKLSGISPHIKVNQITKSQRADLVKLIKNLEMTVKGFRPLEEAIITSGGVRVSEINPKTMQSKIIDNLSFAGEVLDVDAYTGGFNLQIAFSTGCVAGKNILK